MLLVYGLFTTLKLEKHDRASLINANNKDEDGYNPGNETQLAKADFVF